MKVKIKILFLSLLALGFFTFGLQTPPASSAGESRTKRSAPAAAPVSIALLPDATVLTGPRASQRLLVQARFSDGHAQDVTTRARFTVSNPKVATVTPEGVVRALSDGEITVTATLGSRKASAAVKIRDAQTPFSWSFRNHVLPAMTKVGCNSGACHGSAAGKNGFKLTLRGYDPETDYFVLTRQAAGRRIAKVEPARSLILLKPTLTIAHGGGKRFEVGSPEYNVIAEWIAAGMPPPTASDPRITGVEVFPQQVTLAPGQKQQILVRARFSDGHMEDVTRWTKYASSDEGVASVSDDGAVQLQGYGEAAISIWYLNQVALARVSVPFPNRIAARVYQNAPRYNYIDDLVIKKLQALHIEPSGLASDTEFIRRAYLDAAGILPTTDEAQRFLADASPDKRTRLIDSLLARSEFVDYWAYKWSDLFLVSSKLPAKSMRAFYGWIRSGVAENKPWDRMARELITASGNSTQNGAVNYYLIHKNPIDLAENFTQAFMGIRLTCARCHNHPLEKWTQRDYYEFANLFSRVGIKNGSVPGDMTVFVSSTGDINHPRLNRPLPPRPLDGQPVSLESPEDRRRVFAEWLTSPERSFFARTIINRVWRNFMGRGLVEPADDLRATNPASNEELFQALTKDFIGRGFDIKHLIRTIMTSATYQLTAKTNASNEKDSKFYSHYIVRRLPAEVLLDAISQVTTTPQSFPGYPMGTRALQLPDTRVSSYFLTAFGRPERALTCECERQQDASLTQALHVINGDTINKKLIANNALVGLAVKMGLSNALFLDHLYLSAYSRYPTAAEKTKLLAAIDTACQEAGPDARKQALEDLVWAVLTGKEFIFNH